MYSNLCSWWSTYHGALTNGCFIKVVREVLGAWNACSLTGSVFVFLTVEDKVKDQLEAANPEPIIEEVVSWIPPTEVRRHCRVITLLPEHRCLVANATSGLSVSWRSVFHLFFTLI